jgi:hypothetical protein
MSLQIFECEIRQRRTNFTCRNYSFHRYWQRHRMLIASGNSARNK